MKQAPKCWNDEINEALHKFNFVRNRGDPCLYYKLFENGDECILLIYVDDILIMSKQHQRIEEVKKQISGLFEIRDLGDIKYYLGIIINKNNGIYNVNQEKYVKEGLWLKKILRDINRPLAGSLTIYKDNQRTLKMFQNEKISNRTKHVDVKFNFIKDYVCIHLSTRET